MLIKILISILERELSVKLMLDYVRYII